MKVKRFVKNKFTFHLQEINTFILATRIKTAGGKSPASHCIFKNYRSIQKFHGQSDVSLYDLYQTCLRPPLAEPHCQVFCSLPTHYATGKKECWEGEVWYGALCMEGVVVSMFKMASKILLGKIVYH
jgi:hypothetical protein